MTNLWGFYWGILHFSKSKITNFRIFTKDFFHFELGHFWNLLRPNYEPQQPHMKYELGWKLKPSETTFYHRDTLTPYPCILNWPKTPHRLGVRLKSRMSYIFYCNFQNALGKKKFKIPWTWRCQCKKSNRIVTFEPPLYLST